MAGRHRGRSPRNARAVKAAALTIAVLAGVGVAAWSGAGASASGSPTLTADTSFNGGNPVLLSWPAPSGGTASGSTSEWTTGIARQSDGKVVVVGYINGYTDSHSLGVSDFDVARLNTNGSLDTTFGASHTGYVAVDPTPGGSNTPQGVVIQPDGKIVIAGYSGGLHIGLARLNTDGSLDSTFGSGGTYVDSSNEGALAIALDSSGDILTTGFGGDVHRFTPSGVPDSTFNSTGKSTALMETGRGIVVQSDGKIVIVGDQRVSSSSHAIVARFNTDGSPDSGFGTSGSTDITPSGSDESLNTVTFEGTSILVGGSVSQGTGGIIARLTPAGALDATFGSGGRIVNMTNGVINVLLYVPHPVYVVVSSDSDEPAESPEDDADPAACTTLPGTDMPLDCVPSASAEDYGSLTAGAETPSANGATVDIGGNTIDFSHATVGQVIATEPSGGTGSTGTTSTTTGNSGGGGGSTGPTGPTTPTCPPPGSQFNKCADFQMSSIYHLEVEVEAFGGLGWEVGPNEKYKQVAPFDSVRMEANVFNLGPKPAHCAVSVTSSVGLEGMGHCFTEAKPRDLLTGEVYWFEIGTVRPGISEALLTARVTATDAVDPTPGDPKLNDDEELFQVPVGRPLEGTPDIGNVTPAGVTGGLTEKPKTADREGSAAAASPITAVQVAIANVTRHGQCRWVASTGLRLTPEHPTTLCADPTWLTARGTQHWSLTLSKRLPRGRYVFLVHAVDRRGDVSGGFARARRTLATLIVS